MIRVTAALLVTLIAIGVLIVVAGRTNWYAMSFRMASDAIDVIDAVTFEDSNAAPAAARTLSDPATWSPDFMRGAIATPDCPTDTLQNVSTRMAAIGPYEVDDFERTVAYYAPTGGEPGEGIPIYNRVSELVRSSIDPADRIYAFGFTSVAARGSVRGFSGYFVARVDCIVHVQVTSYENQDCQSRMIQISRHSSTSLRSAMVIIVSFAAAFADAAAQQTPNDWLIVPGERVGPITSGTSEEMLRSLFGTENVVPTDVYVGEGFTEPGTAVYPDPDTQHLEILWQDDTRTAVSAVRLTGDSTRWHTAEGISLGSTLKEIEELNGFPFRLFGFAWDYGGTVAGCGRGRLRMLGCAGDDGSRRSRSILLRLYPNVEASAQPAYRQVQGEKEFSSGHPAMQALNPSVYQMVVILAVPE